MKVKHLKKGEFRVIQVDEEAIFELLRETMMERASDLFGILDSRKVRFEGYWDRENVRFTCAIYDGRYETRENDGFKLDLKEISEEIGVTTETLYGRNLYVTLTDPAASEAEPE